MPLNVRFKKIEATNKKLTTDNSNLKKNITTLQKQNSDLAKQLNEIKKETRSITKLRRNPQVINLINAEKRKFDVDVAKKGVKIVDLEKRILKLKDKYSYLETIKPVKKEEFNSFIYSSLQEALNKKAEKGVLQGQRKLRKGLHGKRVVFFSSKKNGALMPCESRLEADNCMDLELDSNVVKYRTQPISFDLGQGQSYTPDSVHVDNFGSVIVREAKIKKVLGKPGLVERLTRIRKILFAQNISFYVVTEKELQQQPRLENQKLLYRYANHSFSNKRLEAQAEFFREQGFFTFTLREFRELCTDYSLVPQFADILILHGFAKYDETKTLNPNSEISLIGGTK